MFRTLKPREGVVELTPHHKLANDVAIMIRAATNISANWILPQIDSRFDEEPELRNKLFTIYIYGLLDACHGTDSRIVDIKRRATKLNAKGALHYLNVLRTYVDSILDICGIFSRGEMLVIGELRTQNVHGHGRNTAKTDISGSSKITP
jgi:hypothetical protein